MFSRVVRLHKRLQYTATQILIIAKQQNALLENVPEWYRPVLA